MAEEGEKKQSGVEETGEREQDGQRGAAGGRKLSVHTSAATGTGRAEGAAALSVTPRAE